jgi:type I restriction enzyme S subunit
MKLRKDIWRECPIDAVAEEISIRVDKPSDSGYEKFIGLEHFISGDFSVKNYGSTADLNSAMKVFKPGNLLFARRNAYLKRASIVNFEGVCSGDAIVIQQNGELLSQFLVLILNTSRFWAYAISNAAGTMSKRVKWRDIAKYQFKLPPKDEQEKILSLFLTLEKQIEQTEAQEGNLRKLRTKLATELVSNTPKFGSLLNGNCKKVTLSDLAKESRATARNPLDEGIERFVGLEHIEPGNLKIQGWGNVADGTTFTKVFEEGDVLFGRRRAYLKKAAKADFKGLCSGDITVLKANPKNIKPELLPYYMSADPVFEFAVSNSAGSLSPRAKWRDLSKMELAIPDLKTQEEILKVFELLDKNIEGLANQKETLKKLKHKLLDEILG